MGYRIHIAVHAWLIEGNRLGTLADVEVSCHDSTVHVQGLFHLKAEADDCDVIR